MKRLLNIMLLLSGLTIAQAQSYSSLVEIAQRWADVTIRDVDDGSLPTMLQAFDRTWHTAPVKDVLGVLSQGKTRCVLDEDTGYIVQYDEENGYVELEEDGTDNPYMQACYWQRPEGHRLFAIMLGAPVDPDMEVLCCYDFDSKTRTLVPEASIPVGLPALPEDARRSHELPHRGNEMMVTEHHEEEVIEYLFAWDGTKPVLSATKTQCYDCAMIVDDEYVYPVPSETGEPTITDFVDVCFGNGMVLPELLGDVRYAWHRYRMSKWLPANTTFLLDKRSGYMRFEKTWAGGSRSEVEMCYWNCSDSRHKLVAESIVTYDEDGRYACMQYDGYTFYVYDAQTKTMKQAPLSDIVSGDFAVLENIQSVVLSLPRTGKDIEVKHYAPSGVQTLKLVWDGNKFLMK
ncbi:MAG: hypothetical protein J5543_07650 [Bacteroidales bacterium]|nr:hypothetical protein [Bacteroidales bacterium]